MLRHVALLLFPDHQIENQIEKINKDLLSMIYVGRIFFNAYDTKILMRLVERVFDSLFRFFF